MLLSPYGAAVRLSPARPAPKGLLPGMVRRIQPQRGCGQAQPSESSPEGAAARQPTIRANPKGIEREKQSIGSTPKGLVWQRSSGIQPQRGCDSHPASDVSPKGAALDSGPGDASPGGADGRRREATPAPKGADHSGQIVSFRHGQPQRGWGVLAELLVAGPMASTKRLRDARRGATSAPMGLGRSVWAAGWIPLCRAAYAGAIIGRSRCQLRALRRV